MGVTAERRSTRGTARQAGQVTQLHQLHQIKVKTAVIAPRLLRDITLMGLIAYKSYSLWVCYHHTCFYRRILNHTRDELIFYLQTGESMSPVVIITITLSVCQYIYSFNTSVSQCACFMKTKLRFSRCVQRQVYLRSNTVRVKRK